MKYYVGNSFACGAHTGNPAGVVVVDQPVSDAMMQGIAFENGLSETAFIQRDDDAWNIAWFTPKKEVGFCGHATLGAAYMILNYLDVGKEKVIFHSRRDGDAYCEKDGDLYFLDFPTRGLAEMTGPSEIERAFGCKPLRCYHDPVRKDIIFALLENAEQVAALVPDLDVIRSIPHIDGVVAMAPGTDTDYVCRFFGPAMGIPEDPVTGSIEMCMIPFWRKRLGKDELTDRQLSQRGGIKYLRYKGDRVQIGGRVDMYLIGEILDKTEVAQHD